MGDKTPLSGRVSKQALCNHTGDYCENDLNPTTETYLLALSNYIYGLNGLYRFKSQAVRNRIIVIVVVWTIAKPHPGRP